MCDSKNEPGQPWDRSSGKALSFVDRQCTAWVLSPSMSILICGKRFRRLSCFLQSKFVSQYRMRCSR